MVPPSFPKGAERRDSSNIRIPVKSASRRHAADDSGAAQSPVRMELLTVLAPTTARSV
jgi:hypothetical protein